MAVQPPRGTVRPTPARALAVAALFGGLGGWLVVVTARAVNLVPPQVPWTAPAAVALVGLLVGVLAYTTHQRIQVRRERVEPQRAVALLVLGKASALGGAVIAGGYLGFAVMFLNRFEAVAPRQRVVTAAVLVVLGVGMSLAGLRLERACRVPPTDDDTEEQGGPADSPA